MDATTIGVDLAKSVFQVSLANRAGRIVQRKRLSRRQFERFLVTQGQAEIVMEACATAHHWARTAQGYGHTPRLLHANYVRPYVRRNKTDAADADALIKASRDPDLRPIPVKSTDQQALQGLHRIRQQWVATKRQRICMVRALFGEFGIHLPAGARGIGARFRDVVGEVPLLLRTSVEPVLDEIDELQARLTLLDKQLAALAAQNEDATRLMTVPGIGPTIATAFVGSVPDIHAFPRARQFSAWLGLTPREYSSGNSRVLGGISKRGDCYLRMLLIHGARAALLLAHRTATKGEQALTPLQRWVLDVERRTNHNKATVALANKMARIVWIIWTTETPYAAK